MLEKTCIGGCILIEKKALNLSTNATDMSKVYEFSVPQKQFPKVVPWPRQTSAPCGRSSTLHYLPPVSKHGNFNKDNYKAERFQTPSSGQREMDSVDEEIITRLCYALELDKLYTLPDLGLGADIVDKM